MNDILRVEHLNKSYKDFSLTDISFSITEGCITGFIGTNGAGKTTTLRTILGLAKKDSGNVNIFGLDMDKNGKQIKDRIGVVLDGGCFYEELSLNEMKNIISSSYSRWSEQDFRHYMNMFALDPKQKKPAAAIKQPQVFLKFHLHCGSHTYCTVKRDLGIVKLHDMFYNGKSKACASCCL